MAKYRIQQLAEEIRGITRAIKGNLPVSDADKKILDIAKQAQSAEQVVQLLKAYGIPAEALIDYESTLTAVYNEKDPFQGVPRKFTTGRKIDE